MWSNQEGFDKNNQKKLAVKCRPNQHTNPAVCRTPPVTLWMWRLQCMCQGTAQSWQRSLPGPLQSVAAQPCSWQGKLWQPQHRLDYGTEPPSVAGQSLPSSWPSRCQSVHLDTCSTIDIRLYSTQICSNILVCLCGSLAQCALSLKRLSAGPGFNPQTQQNELFQDYWRACFEINSRTGKRVWRCPL